MQRVRIHIYAHVYVHMYKCMYIYVLIAALRMCIHAHVYEYGCLRISPRHVLIFWKRLCESEEQKCCRALQTVAECC